MNKLHLLIAAALLGSAASAATANTTAAASPVDPSLPMVTGRGNIAQRVAPVIVTHQVATTAATDTNNPITLENYVVTGSLLPHAAARAVKPSPKAAALPPAAAPAAQTRR